MSWIFSYILSLFVGQMGGTTGLLFKMRGTVQAEQWT